MVTEQQRNKRVDKASLRVLFQVPFFAPGVARLPVEWDTQKQIPTACTDGRRILFNTEFFDKLTDQELVTVLCHEVCHPELGHLWRMPPGADPEVWNESCDHCVNNMLKGFSEAVKARRLADPFPFPEGAWCCDPAFADKCEEEIYRILSKRPKGKGQGKPPRKPFGEFTSPKAGQDPAAQKQLKTEWERTLIQSTELAKGRGDCPGSLERLVKDLLDSKVPWYELLRNWLREQASDDWNWMNPNKLYSDNEFVLPVLESERIGSVVFATDTSGSIDQETLRHFQSEKQACLDDMRPAKLVDIYCDSRIHKFQEYSVGEEISRDAPGGGGTDFRPVFERVSELDPAPKCLVYLTDLDGSFPGKAPDYPVLWVTWESEGSAPFGEVIRVKQA